MRERQVEHQELGQDEERRVHLDGRNDQLVDKAVDEKLVLVGHLRQVDQFFDRDVCEVRLHLADPLADLAVDFGRLLGQGQPE